MFNQIHEECELLLVEYQHKHYGVGVEETARHSHSFMSAIPSSGWSTSGH